MRRSRSDLEEKPGRPQLRIDNQAEHERLGDYGRARPRIVVDRCVQIDRAAKRTGIGRLTMVDSQSTILLAGVDSAVGIYEMRHAELCRRRNRLPEMKENSECKQKAQNCPSPTPMRWARSGPPRVTAFFHQNRTPSGTIPNSIDDRLSVTGSIALMQIKTPDVRFARALD